jgi:hypothetical protein
MTGAEETVLTAEIPWLLGKWLGGSVSDRRRFDPRTTPPRTWRTAPTRPVASSRPTRTIPKPHPQHALPLARTQLAAIPLPL